MRNRKSKSEGEEKMWEWVHRATESRLKRPNIGIGSEKDLKNIAKERKERVNWRHSTKKSGGLHKR